jgi:hypothetical protein
VRGWPKRKNCDSEGDVIPKLIGVALLRPRADFVRAKSEFRQSHSPTQNTTKL